MRKSQYDIEYPIGDPFGGPAYGKREDPPTLAAAAAWTSIIGGGVSIGKQLGMFGETEGPGAPPTLEKPNVMPTPDDAAIKAAKRRSLAAQTTRRGRQSTILSDPTQSSDLLGG